jgi:NADPH:quinone reductase-like Zn-dependent oxidoreductase
MIDQGHCVTSWPLIPGLDGAGVVEAIGEHVKRFKIRDEALAQSEGGNRGASYQVVVVVKEGTVARKLGGGRQPDQ